MRESGVLMPVSALPSPTGVGELGRQAHQFIELLSRNGVKIWQILPLNPVGYGNSPYQPYSSCAGDEIYLSLESLQEEGLLEKLPEPFLEGETRVRYDQVRAFKDPFLREAFARFQPTDDYQEFIAQSWVEEYGVFRALKRANGGVCWNEWKEADKAWPEERSPLPADVEAEAAYQMFLQYLFYRQWMKVREKARENGIRIMGDVPFYVGVDSVEVWAGRENFLLDSDGRPTFIAGVPPDYFSATGQRWGNPIYDWDRLRADGYRFWVERIGYCQTLFDLIRIDHFRAFDTFWKIPASCPTAVEGEWVEAPGYAVLDALFDKLPGLNLVAEDLGDLRPQVLELRDHYQLPGMKVLSFTLEPAGRYIRDREADQARQVVYTGTHDNATAAEWYRALSPSCRRKLRRYLKVRGIQSGTMAHRLIRLGLQSRADLCVVPLQDVLGLGGEARMNTPGTVGSPNWEWRLAGWTETERNLALLRPAILDRRG